MKANTFRTAAGLVIACIAFFVVIADKKAARQREEQVRGIMDLLDAHDISHVHIAPLLSRRGSRELTVKKRLLIEDRQVINDIVAAMKEGRHWTYYLPFFKHWSSARYAKLTMHFNKSTNMSFSINWNADFGVCEYALIRNSEIKVYDASNNFDLFASTELSNLIDNAVSNAGIQWVTGDHTKEIWEPLGPTLDK